MAINVHHMQTINYEVFAEGDRYLGTASVDLPEINAPTSEIKGAGIAGQMDFPTLGQTENLELTLHWRSIFERPVELFRQRGTLLTLRGAMQKYAAESGLLEVLPVRIEVRVVPTSLNLGKLEPGEMTDTESKFSADFLKIVVDNVTELEIDKLNYLFNVGGTDYLAGVRDALGL